jgi:hypothetical protein
MDSAELSRIERRLRRVYEWSRMRRALVGFAPVLVLVTAAVWLGERRSFGKRRSAFRPWGRGPLVRT